MNTYRVPVQIRIRAATALHARDKLIRGLASGSPSIKVDDIGEILQDEEMATECCGNSCGCHTSQAEGS